MKIAWVSRHEPLERQIQELKRLFGEIEVVKFARTFKDAGKLASEISGCDYAVVVLPLSMIAELIKRPDCPKLLRAEMRLLHNCETLPCPDFQPETDVLLRGEETRHYRFEKFVRIVELKLITKEV